MRSFGPRALTPRDGWNWLSQAWQLMWRHPLLFIAIAIIAPAGSATLLALPLWHWWLPPLSGWSALVATVFCYGLPLSITITLACVAARAVNRLPNPTWKQLLKPLLQRTALKALSRACLFLLSLLLQGYLLVYWMQDQLLPIDAAVIGTAIPAESLNRFGVTETLLGTQLSVLGSVLLGLQMLFALFILPLQLFRELPLSTCWRRSLLALQLNPWLFPSLGLSGLTLLVVPFFTIFAIPAQVLALPLPVYFGILLYVAWNEVFQGGTEEDEVLSIQKRWTTSVSGEAASRQSLQKRRKHH